MENSYINTEAFVRRARQQRSQAMADILTLGWRHLTQWVAHPLHHQPQHNRHVTNH